MQASPASAAPIPAAAALFTVPAADVVRMIEDHGELHPRHRWPASGRLAAPLSIERHHSTGSVTVNVDPAPMLLPTDTSP